MNTGIRMLRSSAAALNSSMKTSMFHAFVLAAAVLAIPSPPTARGADAVARHPLSGIGGLPTANTTGTTAVSAHEFLQSIGVCTHITQGEDNPTKVAECLTYAGIRAIRDDGSRNPKTLQFYLDVHQASGAKVVLLPINGDIAASLKQYETLAAAGARLAAEGPNEPNNWHVAYEAQNRQTRPLCRLPASRETYMPP